MARKGDRLASNVQGDFYVDSSCIDCATCRWMAPETFNAYDGYSRVFHQPDSAEDVHRALMALVACPTASIGTVGKHALAPVIAAFPTEIAEGVYHVGYHARSSFGAASYLLTRKHGNVLIDSPRFSKALARNIQELGGVDQILLTHKDDIADHERWARYFGARRVMHEADAGSGTRGAVEAWIRGSEAVELGEGLLALPTPGHTRGSMCLLADERFAFTGDHLAYSRDRDQLYAFRRACWFDWSVQIESMKRLAEHTFEWVLPGHGRRAHYGARSMEREMARCIAWMKAR